jgi:ArsR family transcriptional regulator
VPSTRRAASSGRRISEQRQVQLAGYCKALAHPVRVEIIKILLAKGSCISGDLAESFDKAHSTVSEHLKILKESGLVQGTIDGPKRCYCVNPEALRQMKQLLNLLIFDPECCRPTANQE